MPVYENSTPVGTYYGEQGNQQSDMYQEIMRRAAENADPARQAEQDARIQRSRNFWTGANLFANVVANAINVNGTARNAPNMTWNDAATQKMYDTWQTADKELRADRKAAAQRLDALQMEDAKLRAAGAEKRAAERQRAADMNFNIALEEARHERALQEKEADRGYAEQLADKKRQQDLEDYEKKLQMQARYRPRTAGRSGSGTKSAAGTKTPSVGKNSIVSGGITMNVNTKADRDTMYKSMYNEMERWIKEHPEAMPEGAKMPTDEYGKRKFVDDHFGDLCKDNPDFMDEMQGYYGDLLMLDEDFGGATGDTTGVATSPVVGSTPGSGTGYGLRDTIARAQAAKGAYDRSRTQQVPDSVVNPEYEQFAGYSVMPENGFSKPLPRKYQGTTEGTERAYGVDKYRSMTNTQVNKKAKTVQEQFEEDW